MKKIIIIGFLLFTIPSIAQISVISGFPFTLNIGGGTGSITNNFLVDWSIGESTCIQSFNGKKDFAISINDIIWNLTCGILQPNDKAISKYNNIPVAWSDEEISLFPIPAKDNITIEFKEIADVSVPNGKISIQFLDQFGKILEARDFLNNKGQTKQTWDISRQASGTLFFNIVLRSEQGQIIKRGTYRVIKIK